MELNKLCFVFRAIRELATKALHNLTPRAPDYMANTGDDLVVILQIQLCLHELKCVLQMIKTDNRAK